MNKPQIDHIGFPKIGRFSRPVIVTEKLDGTSGLIYIDDTMTNVYAGSRTKWITPDDDNYGFARWIDEHHDELLKLGPGSHFGEWWGAGIQRRYGLKEKRFSLFNVSRWGTQARVVDGTFEFFSPCPACCSVVPILWTGSMDDFCPDEILSRLRLEGSVAAPGFMRPEGIVIYHTAANVMFKKTLENDSKPKSKVQG